MIFSGMQHMKKRYKKYDLSEFLERLNQDQKTKRLCRKYLTKENVTKKILDSPPEYVIGENTPQLNSLHPTSTVQHLFFLYEVRSYFFTMSNTLIQLIFG
eukprot:TRINITY_DN32845_c0_g2_i1.p5 TRINITY_DN32845_c0_g2~~TRINITY_DN32845_c0_g2_i1.p5  ORF type:complete len:100 (-),score=4.79 TRINITY_DN32845_c0_g2_i1:815-1114(-)